ncbi:hypothetical protein LINPERPRIM_LOCUS15414 [Linum perenne]
MRLKHDQGVGAWQPLKMGDCSLSFFIEDLF